MLHERSIAFQTNKPLTAYGPLAAQACGFDAVTVYNDLMYQPAWLPLMEMARATKRVRVGVAAVSPFTCHPISIAGNIALIDEASNGRAYVGLARGAWLDYLGAGKYFPLWGGERMRWDWPRAEVPILLGSWGERTMRACLPYIVLFR